MCIYHVVVFKCGHKRPSSIMENGQPFCVNCEPMFIAMHYYHDQKLYQSFEGLYEHPGRVLSCPRPCPLVGETPWSVTAEAKQFEQWSNSRLKAWMDYYGVDDNELFRVRNLVARRGVDSTRRTNPQFPLQPYPLQMLGFVKLVDMWQMEWGQKTPNIRYHYVEYGCGAKCEKKCLEGWTGQDVLMFRHGKLNVKGIWNPQPVGKVLGWMAVEFPNVQVHGETAHPEVARPIVYIPVHELLADVLWSIGQQEMLPGTLEHNYGCYEEGIALGWAPGVGAAMCRLAPYPSEDFKTVGHDDFFRGKDDSTMHASGQVTMTDLDVLEEPKGYVGKGKGKEL